jgi:hypothetical protein
VAAASSPARRARSIETISAALSAAPESVTDLALRSVAKETHGDRALVAGRPPLVEFASATETGCTSSSRLTRRMFTGQVSGGRTLALAMCWMRDGIPPMPPTRTRPVARAVADRGCPPPGSSNTRHPVPARSRKRRQRIAGMALLAHRRAAPRPELALAVSVAQAAAPVPASPAALTPAVPAAGRACRRAPRWPHGAARAARSGDRG